MKKIYVFGVWLYIHEFLEMSLSEMSHRECKYSFPTVRKTIFQIGRDNIYSKSLRIKQVLFLTVTFISYQFHIFQTRVSLTGNFKITHKLKSEHQTLECGKNLSAKNGQEKIYFRNFQVGWKSEEEIHWSPSRRQNICDDIRGADEVEKELILLQIFK